MILAKPNHIKIYGHRGARGDLPENTLYSFKYLFDNNVTKKDIFYQIYNSQKGVGDLVCKICDPTAFQ